MRMPKERGGQCASNIQPQYLLTPPTTTSLRAAVALRAPLLLLALRVRRAVVESLTNTYERNFSLTPVYLSREPGESNG